MAASAPARIGSYEIAGELGRGGMGVVYDARDLKIGRNVALKTILWRDLGDQSERDWLRERLFREARSAGSLNHPGIVIIYESGEDAERAYIAMERVEGPTLESILKSGRTSDRTTLLSILEQSAEALDFAHENGVVHCDVKPANIMLHRNSRVKIADFGIAKVLSTQYHTKTGMVMGTPSYMSPEQIKALPLDGRADQFSLGVIAFEMLAGAKPFNGDTLASLVHQIVYEEPRTLLEMRPELGRGVEAVLRKALSKGAAERYPTCAQFVQALRVVLDAAAKEAAGPKPQSRGASATLVWVAAVAVSSVVFFGVGYEAGRGAAPGNTTPAVETKSSGEPPARPSLPMVQDPPKLQIDVEAILRRADQFVEKGAYNEAIAEYNTISSADPGNSRASSGRAKAVKAKNTEENLLK